MHDSLRTGCDDGQENDHTMGTDAIAFTEASPDLDQNHRPNRATDRTTTYLREESNKTKSTASEVFALCEYNSRTLLFTQTQVLAKKWLAARQVSQQRRHKQLGHFDASSFESTSIDFKAGRDIPKRARQLKQKHSENRRPNVSPPRTTTHQDDFLVGEFESHVSVLIRESERGEEKVFNREQKIEAR